MVTGHIKTSTKEQFHQKIFSWWDKNRRSFPWRKTIDPYFIMVSEVMLQQTQTSQVSLKYSEFIENFPTAKELAVASKADILTVWSGLGYNRRALWLQEAARTIDELESFPQTPEELMKLKGIGEYAARSILIFAFNFNIATVDTNIRRIFIAENFANEETSEKQLFEIATELLPLGKSRDWHNALMDYGATFLTSRKTGISPTSKYIRFKGSDREKRGQILNFVLENKEASISDLRKLLSTNKDHLDAILEKMIKEGLLTKTKGNYSV